MPGSFVLAGGKTKLPPHRISFCARADNNLSVVPPCLLCIKNTATLRRANTPLPCNGGFRQRILGLAFPRALSEPLYRSASRPVPSIGGSLCVRLWFYFRFIGLKYL